MLQNNRKWDTGAVSNILTGDALHAGGGKEADVPAGTLTWGDKPNKLIFLILLQQREADRKSVV